MEAIGALLVLVLYAIVFIIAIVFCIAGSIFSFLCTIVGAIWNLIVVPLWHIVFFVLIPVSLILNVVLLAFAVTHIVFYIKARKKYAVVNAEQE